ncbi:MAG: porin family protein [Bryobacteraceae bacterium]|nr:porin family protein [Bryobacteraceae bacterium]
MSGGIVFGRSVTGSYIDQTRVYSLPPVEPGGPWTLWFGSAWSRSRDWVGGGMLDIRFTDSWSLEVNGLFRQLNGQSASFGILEKRPARGSPHQIVTWQFPVLAKYRFQGQKLRPFVGLGPAFRTAGNVDDKAPSHHGIAAGAGLEFRLGTLQVSPAIRYTLWAGDRHGTYESDQVELLVGFSRTPETAWRPFGPRASLGFKLALNLIGDYPDTREVWSSPGYPGDPVEVFRQPYTSAAYTSGGRSILFGPAVEFEVSRGLSFEISALHRPVIRRRRFEITSATFGTFGYSTRLRTGVIWHFPILAKSKFRLRKRPFFFGAGPSLRLRQTYQPWTSAYGVSATAGLELRGGPVTIAPSILYTHWGPHPRNALRRNQADILLSLRF